MNNNRLPPVINTVDALEYFLQSQYGYSLYTDAPPVNVDRIAQLLGIEVVDQPTFDPNELAVIGKITLQPGENARVWINSNQNSYAPRRRFTLAHEIGHFCMHRHGSTTTFVDTKSSMNRTESYWDKHEFEANNFAADLLMPAQLIRDVGGQIIANFQSQNPLDRMPLPIFRDQLALRFQVSSMAMEYRLKNLGIIGSS